MTCCLLAGGVGVAAGTAAGSSAVCAWLLGVTWLEGERVGGASGWGWAVERAAQGWNSVLTPGGAASQ